MSEMNDGPGAALKDARTSLGITCREVAEALNLPLRVVEALEVNDHDKLPVAVFTRGYIRAYAKLLELDPGPLVARYRVEEDEEAARNEAAGDSVQAAMRNHPEWFIGGGAVILLGLIGLVLYALWPLDTSPETDVSDMPPVESIEEKAATVAFSAAVQTAPGVSSPGEKVIPEQQNPAAATLEEVDESGNPVRRISASGDDRLWFAFTDECWVEVLSTTGENLYSDLSRSGQTLELVGSGPFRILLGYAPGVRMAFNGEPVVLGPHTRNNVANLVLGQ